MVQFKDTSYWFSIKKALTDWDLKIAQIGSVLNGALNGFQLKGALIDSVLNGFWLKGALIGSVWRDILFFKCEARSYWFSLKRYLTRFSLKKGLISSVLRKLLLV